MVVLPAPSGPTRPVMRPASTVRSTPSSAAAPALRNRLVTPRARAIGSLMSLAGGRPGGRNADGDRLALPQTVVRIVDDDPQAID